MEIPAIVIHNGRKYSIQTTGRYYQSYSRSKNQIDRLLHRVVWVENNGPIPDGFEVHHKDGCWYNNDISNLELVETSKHRSFHAKKNLECPERTERIMAGLEKAREAAKEWHASEEGRAWHSEHGKDSWKNRERDKHCKCNECGKEFMSYKDSKYCSLKCNQAALDRKRKEENPDKYLVDATCRYCGSNFKAYKYKSKGFCSKRCSANNRWHPEKAVRPDS